MGEWLKIAIRTYFCSSAVLVDIAVYNSVIRAPSMALGASISRRRPFPSISIRFSLFLLSAATLAFEINLTRLFSVAQFYHFAFMIVSIALLGYALSGTALTILSAPRRADPQSSLVWLSLATALSILVAYLATNWLPFDSYSLLVDRKQVFILIFQYIVLSAPFFFSGMALAGLLAGFPARAGSTYAVNLFGSALGCAIALLAPAFIGGEGMVTLSCLLAALAAVATIAGQGQLRRKLPAAMIIAILLVFSLLDLGLRLAGQNGLKPFELRISPYKSLSYALQAPGAQLTRQLWNAFSRVDIVHSPSIHSVPGLSYRYLQPLPAMDGLLVDGDDLSPLVQRATDPYFTAYLPTAIAYLLHPHASTLVLQPRGGVDILAALSSSSGRVTCVELNPLIVEVAPAYADQRLSIHVEDGRSYLQRTHEKFDIIVLSLASSFHPVQSGAYSLAEDYYYTLESFQEMLAHLTPGGLLVSMRWLQDPPSEDLRLFALAVEAVRAMGGDPALQIAALRGYNTATVLVSNGAFSSAELGLIRQFSTERAFDLTYLPGINAAETNRYNILPEPIYYQAYLGLVDASSAVSFYRSYAYDVRPPTDDHPFFGHYFKWEQTPQVLAQFGRAWLPFGGSGYLVILALLALAILLAIVLILLPAWFGRLRRFGPSPVASPYGWRGLAYFGLLGLAFMFVEVPLLQRFILYLGNPAYAFTGVLFALLVFSGLGSQLSRRLPLRLMLSLLAILAILEPLILSWLFAATLGLPLALRLLVAVLSLAPLGFLMGVPFPAGLRLLMSGGGAHADEGQNGPVQQSICWAWAVNGAASVVAPILAALLALSYGFRLVLWLGAVCYGMALLTVWLLTGVLAPLRPRR